MLKSLANFALLLALCAASFAAQAQQLKISGAYFSVDRLSSVDANNVEVRLFGEARLISKANVDDFVVEAYFSDVSRLVDLSDLALQNFLREALKERNYTRAALAFRPLCSRQSVTQQVWHSFIDSLLAQVGSAEFFKVVVVKSTSSACSNEINAKIILHAGLGDSAWLRTNGLRFAIHTQQALRKLLRERFRQSSLSRNFTQNTLLLDFYATVFGTEDLEYAELNRSNQKIVGATEDIRQGNLERIITLVDLTKSDLLLSEIIFPLLIEGVHEQAEKYLAKGDANKAIEILSHIDLKRRTITTHDMIRRTLAAVKVTEAVNFVDPYISSWLKAVSLADQAVKEAYLKFLDRLFSQYLREGRLEEVRQQLTNAVFLRPDPSFENDQVRLGLIRVLLARGSHFLASQELQLVQTSVPLPDKIRFMFSGLYFDIRYLYITLIAPLLAAFVLGVVGIWRRHRAGVVKRLNKIAEESFATLSKANSEESIRPQFVSNRLMRSLSPSMIEYRECLAVFKLTPEADLKTIKSAYRAAVKEVHPDHLGTSQDPKASEKFIELTRIYERLLELREVCRAEQN